VEEDMLVDELTGADLGKVDAFEGTSVWSLLTMRSEQSAERTAFTWHPFDGEPQSWTYGRLHTDAENVAKGMASRGTTAGDRVLIHLENCPEFILSWYACAALGAIAVTTNTGSSEDELRYFFGHSEASAVITQPKFFDRVQSWAPTANWFVTTDHDAGVTAAPKTLPAAGDFRFASLMHGADADLPSTPPSPRAPMSIQYTSGTTARPKAVLWSNANALWGASINARQQDLRPDDCYLCYLPLFHTNAVDYTMLASLWVGSRFVLIPKWTTTRFWDISLTYGCTWLSCGGLAARAISASEPPPGHKYRMFGTMECHMPWAENVGVTSLGMWGMTETIAHPLIGDAYTRNRPGSVGRPAPEYEISVVDDQGRPATDEQVGRLLVRGVRGVSLFEEYYKDPAATAAAFDDRGWFDTGDLAVAHPDGHVSYMGRSKDMLKVGGENVAAAEIEQVALTIAGVLEAAVVGRADDKLDEVPVLFVVTNVAAKSELAEAVSAACREQLAKFKHPRRVFVVAELPRSGLGKVNKDRLRAAAEDGVDVPAEEQHWLDAAQLEAQIAELDSPLTPRSH
jgi:carnitine-CoA ligase